MANDTDLLATFVHISDLHIGDIDPNTGNAIVNRTAALAVKNFAQLDGLLGHQARSLQDLTDFWKKYPRPTNGPFGLVVTGDYTRCGGTQEFQTATSYLTGQVNLRPLVRPVGLNIHTLLLGIPGNHDQWGGVNFPWGSAQSVYGVSHLSSPMPFVSPAIRLASGNDLIFCGVDSDADVSSRSLGRLRAIGSFQSQLASLATMLGPKAKDEIRVLLVHHSWSHSGWTLRMTKASKTAMSNFVAAHGVKIVLSGHTHGVKTTPISVHGPASAHELCCGTTTQFDHVPYEWATLMGSVPKRNWPTNALFVHKLRQSGAALTWEAQPWFRDPQAGFRPANFIYSIQL
ncbi:metallophosphoesterase family protein [Burkholderia cepacia]|uniref:metallophosphoesterase family protein n=1 Tax=Burkholderia cepacia TaxID=292 RepID=UPI0009C04EC1|nr:metallophosphoesterase [Burkholderia cepacia]